MVKQPDKNDFGGRSRRGMMLAGTMLVLMGILAVTLIGAVAINGSGNSGLYTNTNNTAQLTGARMQSVGAFNMADAGVQYAMEWLNSLSSPPSTPTSFYPKFKWQDTSYTTTPNPITPDPSNPGNSFTVKFYPDVSSTNNYQKKFLVESVGVSGTTKQIIQVYLEESSLSKWLVLNDTWPGDNYWVSGLSTFDGPVHDNNSDGVNENVYWFNTPSPMWSYSGSDAYNLSGNVNWVPGAPQNASDWSNILAGGSPTFTSGTGKIPFPSSSNVQRNVCLGLAPDSSATPTIPSTTGVTVTPNGGIYIHCANSQDDTQSTPPAINNDVQQMTLSVDAGGNQVVTVLQNDDNGNPMTTKVTLNVSANQTQVQVSQQPAGGGTPVLTNSAVTGLGKGVVYCDGNIGAQGTAPGDPKNGSTKTGGLAGTIADSAYDSNGQMTYHSSLTIATDASKNTNIDGDIVYKTARQKDQSGNYLPENQDTNFTKNAGVFGLVSNTVLLTTQDANGNQKNNYEVDGDVMAYTLYEVDQFLTRPTGNWENMGGYLSKRMGYFGQFNWSGQLVTGMNNSFNYDIRMRDNPPPYFPTTGNSYDMVSWRRVSQTLE